MTPHEPLILDYRGPADRATGSDDEYGFMHELFGWFLVSLIVVALFAGMILGLSVLVRVLH